MMLANLIGIASILALGELILDIQALGCYDPLCGQKTAFISRLFGHPGLDIFLDLDGHNEVGNLVKMCASMDMQQFFCTEDVEDGHIHMRLQSEDESAFEDLSVFRDNIISFTPSYLYGNGSEAFGQKEEYFVVWLQSDAEQMGDTDYSVTAMSAAFIRSPPFASVLAKDFSISYAANARALRTSSNLFFDVDEVYSQALDTQTTQLSSDPNPDKAIEPGSWYFTITPVPTLSDRARGVVALPAYGYIEFVLSRADIVLQRLFPLVPAGPVLVPSSISTLHACAAGDASCDLAHVSLATASSTAGTTGESTAEGSASLPPKINVCLWSSNVMDGQKQIWMTQMQRLNSSEFSFTVVLASKSELTPIRKGNTLSGVKTEADTEVGAEEGDVGAMNDMEKKLHDMRAQGKLRIVRGPLVGFRLDPGRFTEDPGDGSARIEGSEGKDAILGYMHQRYLLAMEKGRNGAVVADITPAWVREPYEAMVALLQEQRCDVSVHGNIRGQSPDFLITDAARAAGVPTVAELLNLYVDPQMRPDVLVGPSDYSIAHDSTKSLLVPSSSSSSTDGDCKSKHSLPLPAPSVLSGLFGGGSRTVGELDAPALDLQEHSCGPVTAVISPSVNTSHFDSARVQAQESWGGPLVTFPGCKGSSKAGQDDHDGQRESCLVVGFMARLSSEKNPGLFVSAAHAILQTHPHARFVMLGDGHLKELLRTHAARLGIATHFAFAGWVPHEQLPHYLSIVDVVINPSVRGWSETFCIANIEAMSMSLPLVTFAAGGVGQYVSAPADESYLLDDNKAPSFSVTDNAVVVHEAHPEAIAAATRVLLDDPALRKTLGKQARHTVETHFRLEQQMERYRQLYKFLYAQKLSLSKRKI